METLKELMTTLPELSERGSNLTQKECVQRDVDLYNSIAGDMSGYDCKECKNKGYISTVQYDETFAYYYEMKMPCKCQRVRGILRRLDHSGLKGIVSKYSFDRYQTPNEWQRRLKQRAVDFCCDSNSGWFFIGGQSGAGKTHLCTAIASYYIKQDKDVRYMLWRDDIMRIKAVANDADRYAALMRPLKDAEVLYIDDLFKDGVKEGARQSPSPAEIRAAFEVINYRYNNLSLVTIISSESCISDIAEIDEAIAGRIAEMAGEYCINLRKDRTRNWRLKCAEEI